MAADRGAGQAEDLYTPAPPQAPPKRPAGSRAGGVDEMRLEQNRTADANKLRAVISCDIVSHGSETHQTDVVSPLD
jgi:hypothetical protein